MNNNHDYSCKLAWQKHGERRGKENDETEAAAAKVLNAKSLLAAKVRRSAAATFSEDLFDNSIIISLVCTRKRQLLRQRKKLRATRKIK
jgi:hypothetical protein